MRHLRFPPAGSNPVITFHDDERHIIHGSHIVAVGYEIITRCNVEVPTFEPTH